MARTKRVSAKKLAPLDGLQPEEAVVVLERLLAKHPELLLEAEEICRSTLGDVSFESIASDVESAIRQLDLDDLKGHAGRHSWGYVKPSEAATELFKEATAPFMEELNRKKDLGLDEAAFEICKGIVFGAYQCRNPGGDGVLGWAVDFPGEAAAYAVDTWMGARKPTASGKNPRSKRFREFVYNHVPEWQRLSERVN